MQIISYKEPILTKNNSTGKARPVLFMKLDDQLLSGMMFYSCAKTPCGNMSAEYLILIIGFVFGFYMAWNIGANDVANSMASAVGAKAITIRQAVFIAGILNMSRCHSFHMMRRGDCSGYPGASEDVFVRFYAIASIAFVKITFRLLRNP